MGSLVAEAVNATRLWFAWAMSALPMRAVAREARVAVGRSSVMVSMETAMV